MYCFDVKLFSFPTKEELDSIENEPNFERKKRRKKGEKSFPHLQLRSKLKRLKKHEKVIQFSFSAPRCFLHFEKS